LSDAGSDLYIYIAADNGTAGSNSEHKAIAADGTRKDFITNDTITPLNLSSTYDWLTSGSTNFYIWLGRTTGSAVVEVDYTQLFIGDFLTVENVSAASTESFVIVERKALEVSAAGVHGRTNSIVGNQIDLYPGKLNHMCVMTGTQGANTAFTRTVTLTRTIITPRWSVL